MPALSSAANQEFTIIPTEKPLLISYCNLFYFVLKSKTSIGMCSYLKRVIYIDAI